MPNLIQIKRSDTTAVPSSLANGELAYTGNGDVLFIGSNSVIVAIGGKRVPGTLTANQAIVVNATSYVDQVKTAKLFLTDGTANVTHINATANSTVLGSAANTELTTTWAIKTYVDNKTGSLGASVANTQVVFSDSGTLSGTAAFVFDKTSNTVTLGGPLASGNTTVTGFVNATTTGQFGGTLAAGNTTVTGFVNASTTGQFGGTLAAGNTTVTGFVNATTTGQFGGTLAAGNTTVTGFVNASGVGVFGGTLAAGNTTITGFANVSSTLQVDGSTTFGSDATSNSVFNSKIASNIIPFHSATFTLGNSSFVWSSIRVNDVFGANGNFTGNLTVDGDLLVSGNVTTLNTTNLNVEDPLIRLANGNATTDAVDIGVFGTFGNATVTQHTGFFRDATDGVWKLFAGNIPSLNTATTVDTSNVNFAFADLKVGNFESSKVSTANAQITGGSITGITDLAVADGGTGQSTFTQYGVLFGNNSSAIAVTAAGTAGQVLMVSSGGAPEFATLDGGTF